MGHHKPQGVPEAVRVAQEVLQDILPEIDSARAELLRKKLPAYALMLAQQQGHAPTAETLREAAFSLSGAFGRVAGGGALRFADYERLRLELQVERDNPWVDVIARGDVAGYEALRTARQVLPHAAASWNYALMKLAQAPAPMAMLVKLLEELPQARQSVPNESPHGVFALLVRELDRGADIGPLLTLTDTTAQLFLHHLGWRGRADLIAALCPHEKLAADNGRLAVHIAQAGAAGDSREVIHAMAQVAPHILRDANVVMAAAKMGWSAPVIAFIQGMPANQYKEEAANKFMQCALGYGQWALIEELKPFINPAMTQRWLHHAITGVMTRGDVKTMDGLLERGYLTKMPLGIGDLLDIARRYHQPAMEAWVKEKLAPAQAVSRTAESDAEDRRALAAWQVNALAQALEAGEALPVVMFLGIDLLGGRQTERGYHDAPPTAAEQAIARYLGNRGGGHGTTGAMMEEACRLLRGRAIPGALALFGEALHVHDAVRDLAKGREGLAADVLRLLGAQTHEEGVRRFLGELSAIATLPGREIREVLGRIKISPDVAGKVLHDSMNNGRWLFVSALLDGGHLDAIPARRDELLANPTRAASIAGARAWDRVLPGALMSPLLMRQTPKNISLKLLAATTELVREEHSDMTVARLAAYKLCAVFRSEDRIMRYFERWGRKQQQGRMSLVGMAETIALPQEGALIDPGAWGDFLLRYGPEAGGLLAYGDRIAAPEGSPNAMREKAAQYHYKRGSENPALAAFCFRKGVSEAAHDEALALLAEKKALAQPRVQRIPDMHIDGAEFGMPGAKFYRMKDDDFRGLFLGLMVDCCQHIDKGQAAWCARHGFKSENGGFYAIETADGEIVGETWAWRGTGGQMVFDSLETLGKNMTDNCRVSKAQWSALMERVKERLTAAPGDITALLIGTDGQRCPLLNYNVPDAPPAPYAKALAPALPLDHKSYADSREQYLFWQAEGYKDEPVPAPEGQEIKEWGPPAVAPAPIAPPPEGVQAEALRRQEQLFAEERARAERMLQHWRNDGRFAHDPQHIWMDDGGGGAIGGFRHPRRIGRGPGFLPP